ncbi:gamma-glutamyltransferase family protein [Paenalkalicoccus suaedae]|uniref:Gamma-glutamyltransferase family protein n=1 Tax=Paenalkalicoccus suaedae TaxID=2592382 RepID=A0A859FCX6_9BACI|nr:gamma-glutamyltransferase family protein [Paenalkalicoccus suaedae]QKS70424.1 gamma-glutamyltransferase family protein [Paenalkalicoccus suaedae]
MKQQIPASSTMEASGGMVSTASRQATNAGVEMLAKGGNAIDAAVASAFCLGVSEPQASGIGGQSMALVYLKEENRIFALDGSSRAPFELSPAENPERPIMLGLESSTVPSTVAALGYLHETYGKLPLHDILEPSVRACREGIEITPLIHRMLVKEKEHLIKDPSITKNFFHEKEPVDIGTYVYQPELARTFQRMAKHGWRDFYTGDIGKAIVEDMQKRGGLITEIDMNQIPIPVERETLHSTYRGYELYTYPPPGAGRVLVQILAILEGFPPDNLDTDEAIGAIISALAFRFALNYRERTPMHPDHYLQFVNQMLIDKGYAKETVKRINDIYKLALQDTFLPPPTSGETTHLSAADSDGNAVGITQSIELVFGSKTMAKDLGFFYNNYMSAFNYSDTSHPYYLLPGGRPWSSVAPVLLFENGKARYLLGSPGSARISTTLAQVITRLIDKGEPLDDAIASPRFHASHTGSLMIEHNRFSEEVNEALRLAGFKITKRGDYSFYLGCVQGIQLPKNKRERFFGVADPRRDGTARGPELNELGVDI